MGKLLAWLGGFGRNDRAAVALVFGVSVVPFMLAAGVALDYSRALDLKTELQAALDAGALAAAASRSLSDDQRITLAKTTFTSNFRSRFGVEPVPTVTLVDGTVRASAAAALPTTFMKLAGIHRMEVGANVQIGVPGQRDAEIALVLDYSGSMNGLPIGGGRVKYLSMRDAASRMIDDLTTGEGAKHVKFALVPFSQHVWVSLPGSMVVGEKPGTTWRNCTQDRKYPHNLTVTSPDPDDDDTKWGQPLHLYGTRPCGPYLSNGLVVRPLSSDHAAVKRQLQGDDALRHDPHRARLRVRLACAVIQCAIRRGRVGERQEDGKGAGSPDRWRPDGASLRSRRQRDAGGWRAQSGTAVPQCQGGGDHRCDGGFRSGAKAVNCRKASRMRLGP